MAEYLKDDGKLLVNEQRINPMPVIIGKEKYPENIMEVLRENYKNVISLDALKIARECKNIKAVNTVLIGLLAKTMGIDKEVWIESLKEVVPQKALDVNLKAFEEGYSRG